VNNVPRELLVEQRPDAVTATYESMLDEIEADLNRNSESPAADTPAFLDALLTRFRAVPQAAYEARRAAILIEASTQYYWHGQNLLRAVEPIAMAVMLAESGSDKFVLRRALSVQGLILGDTNATGPALDSLRRALDLAEEMEDPLGVAAAWLNIGVTLTTATLYSDARVAHERAVSAIPRRVDTVMARSMKAKALQGNALCCLRLRDFGRGLEAIRVAIGLLADPNTRDQEQAYALAELVHVHLLVETGRVTEAAARVETALDYAKRSKSVRADVAATSMRALVEVFTGRFADALSHISRALQEARVLPGSLSDTLQVAITTHEQAGLHERAASLHRELVTHVRDTRLANIARNAGLPLTSLGERRKVNESYGAPPSLEPLRGRFNRLFAQIPAPSVEAAGGLDRHAPMSTEQPVSAKFRAFGWVSPWTP